MLGLVPNLRNETSDRVRPRHLRLELAQFPITSQFAVCVRREQHRIRKLSAEVHRTIWPSIISKLEYTRAKRELRLSGFLRQNHGRKMNPLRHGVLVAAVNVW